MSELAELQRTSAPEVPAIARHCRHRAGQAVACCRARATAGIVKHACCPMQHIEPAIISAVSVKHHCSMSSNAYHQQKGQEERVNLLLSPSIAHRMERFQLDQNSGNRDTAVSRAHRTKRDCVDLRWGVQVMKQP